MLEFYQTHSVKVLDSSLLRGILGCVEPKPAIQPELRFYFSELEYLSASTNIYVTFGGFLLNNTFGNVNHYSSPRVLLLSLHDERKRFTTKEHT
ncbi:hypothetical protein [Bacteroides nordii]|uniref:hypothetical protein n=1 Tax=Bacteroides nordii TaxID=291645 RepID=UPI002492818F|nr:hypothetical protein [Bacteroides nordii]